MRRFGALILVAAVCLLTGARDVPQPPSGSIAVSISSWGHPISVWTIDKRGHVARRTSTLQRRTEVRATSFKVGARGYARIRALLAPARRHAGKTLSCTDRITDQPYGSVIWHEPRGPAELRFDYGCRDAETRAIVERLMAADGQIRQWDERK
ncbi:hypothetical protein TPR58_15280 [Sphingomonas sp. HF-S3]|uniref:Uncharacterized protein n=1 Tax=Sphingomonas rustica TaxID=3103142 RepID=A0ABV0BBC5_9SPHN